MPEYDVSLTATVFLSYLVEAESEEEAKAKVEAMYQAEGDTGSETFEFDLGEVTGVHHHGRTA